MIARAHGWPPGWTEGQMDRRSTVHPVSHGRRHSSRDEETTHLLKPECSRATHPEGFRIDTVIVDVTE